MDKQFVTFEDLRDATYELFDRGVGGKTIKSMLREKFGVDRISQLSPKQFRPCFEELKRLG